MFRLLLKDVATKKMLVNFRELTSYLMKEAGMDEELPELVDKMATIKMIGGRKWNKNIVQNFQKRNFGI